MHALSVRREEVNIVAGHGAQKDKKKLDRDAQKDKMSLPLSGRGFVRSAGAPRPDKDG